MTTEEKAKAYDEALKRAEAAIDIAADKDLVKGVATTIFPELRKSEDERIRKAILEFFKLQDDNTTYSFIPKKSILAWLKKQKENIEKEYVFRPLAGTHITVAANQAVRRANEGDRLVLAFNGAYIPVRKGCNASKIVDIYNAFIESSVQSFTHHEIDESLQDAVTHQMEDDGDVDDFVRRGIDDIALKYAVIGAEWQKEQKPAEVDEYKIIKKHITEDSLSSEVNKRLTECGWYVTDEKPAEWSEEDERMLRTIISDGSRGVELDSKQIAWLKSLRPQPQQKPEAKLTGWVARDKCCNALYLYLIKPSRLKAIWIGNFNPLNLSSELFPDLKWEDEPVKVEITIKKK